MLRSLTSGYRDFTEKPDLLSVRYNWIILCLFEGSFHPRFEPPLPGAGESYGMNFWVIPPQTPYIIVARTRRCDRAVFHFSDVPDILRTAAKASGHLARRLSPERLAAVRTLVTYIGEHFNHPTALSEVRYEIVLLQLTLLALEAMDLKPMHPLCNIPRERVEKATAWYVEHMSESPSLRDVAVKVHVSATHLRRHFYERLGKSPKAVFNKLRMQKATTLLVHSSLTLDQIAEYCGFHSASDFCRSFKLHFKVTPNAWRHNVNSSDAAVTKTAAIRRPCR